MEIEVARTGRHDLVIFCGECPSSTDYVLEEIALEGTSFDRVSGGFPGLESARVDMYQPSLGLGLCSASDDAVHIVQARSCQTPKRQGCGDGGFEVGIGPYRALDSVAVSAATGLVLLLLLLAEWAARTLRRRI